MHCEAGATVVDGVALVTATLDNPVAVPRRVRVSNRLDGPVCPPRQAGVPAVGWDRNGVTLRVEADGRRSVGYACPLGDREPADPPAVVADTARATVDDATDGADRPAPEDRRRVRTAIHRLGRSGPPRDAVPTEPDTAGGRTPDRQPPEFGSDDADSAGSETGSAPDRLDEHADPTPPAVATAWLDRVADRVAAAEALTDPRPVDAADALAAAHEVQIELDPTADAPPPPLVAAERLAAEVAADAEALRTVADRADDLATRAAAADPSTAALRRLAGREGGR